MKKPFGLVMIACYTIFAGIFSVALPIIGFGAIAIAEPGAVEQFKFSVGMITGAIAFVVCYGLWTMPAWGLWLGRIYYGASILFSSTSVIILEPKGGFFSLDGLFMLIEIGILIYLFKINRYAEKSLLDYPAELFEG